MPKARRPRTPAARRTVRSPRTAPRRADERDLGFYAFRVRDVMTRRVVTVRDSAPLEEAARRMVRARVSGLPVLGVRDRLVGVVSQKDVVRLLNERAGLAVPRGLFDLLLEDPAGPMAEVVEAARRVLAKARVREAMSRPPISIGDGTRLDEAIGLLISNRINRLPVVTAGRVVGIVTRHDLLAGVSGTI